MQGFARSAETVSTLSNLCTAKLRRLCAATQLAKETPRLEALVRRLMAPWGDKPLSDTPTWRSPVGDDYSPFEFSLTLQPTPRIARAHRAYGSDSFPEEQS